MATTPETFRAPDAINDAQLDSRHLSAQNSLADPENSAIAANAGKADPAIVAANGFPPGDAVLPSEPADANPAPSSDPQFTSRFYVAKPGMDPGVDSITSASATGTDLDGARFVAEQDLGGELGRPV